MSIQCVCVFVIVSVACAQVPDPERSQARGSVKPSPLPRLKSGPDVLAVDPNQPYRPLPANRPPVRETIFEFYLRALNPNRIPWGDRIDQRLAELANQSLWNPYFRVCALQTGAILILLLLCWAWWDKMRQIKWIAAEYLTDALNARTLADRKALEAISRYNEHIESCNRVIEGQESGLPGSSSNDRWRQELQQMKDKLTAEMAKSTRLEEELRDRDRIQSDLEQRLRQLEKAVQERQATASAELIARLQRAEAELSAVKSGRR